MGSLILISNSTRHLRGEEKLLTAETTMDECRALGVKSASAEADITNREAVFAAVAQIEKELGPIDIVVCNAGGMGAPDGNKGASQPTGSSFMQ